MNDSEMIEMYWKRDRSAVMETAKKYGSYLVKIADNILANEGDAQDVVNDTYMKIWEALPPHRPQVFSAYLAKMTRQTAMDMQRRFENAGRSQYAPVSAELGECVLRMEDTARWTEFFAFAVKINSWVQSLPRDAANLFVCRYFYMDPLNEIAGYYSCSETKIRNQLYRIRADLRAYLIKEEQNEMNTERLLDAVGKIDDELILSAEEIRNGSAVRPVARQPKRTAGTKRLFRTGILLLILVWMFLSFFLFADRFSLNNMLANNKSGEFISVCSELLQKAQTEIEFYEGKGISY